MWLGGESEWGREGGRVEKSRELSKALTSP